MEPKNNISAASINKQNKKQWQQPAIVEISRVDIEKGAVATKESIWTPGFISPLTHYHS